MSKLSIQSALITAVAIAGFAVGRSWPATPADDRAYYVKALESSLENVWEISRRRGASIECKGAQRVGAREDADRLRD